MNPTLSCDLIEEVTQIELYAKTRAGWCDSSGDISDRRSWLWRDRDRVKIAIVINRGAALQPLQESDTKASLCQ